MNMTEQKFALRYAVEFTAVTGIMIKSGDVGEYSDSEVETTCDGQLYISGDVWANLLRRALQRCENWAERAAQWGDYDAAANGVSPLWPEDTFIEKADYQIEINPGNKIHRKYGAPAVGPLWSDELAFPFAPVIMEGVLFDEPKQSLSALLDALAVIGTGIVTIGGGWSYGHGRLKPSRIRWAMLDLTNSCHRSSLWSDGFCAWHGEATAGEIMGRKPAIVPGLNWSSIIVDAQITKDQMLAIHTTMPSIDRNIPGKLPDRTLFTRPVKLADKTISAVPVVTGKAFRQAILSSEIERWILSTRGRVCLDPDSNQACETVSATGCNLCRRDLWFGSTEAGGIISVGDALLTGWDSESVFRRQGCEHSQQTVQLFNSEYATAGSFSFTIIIDHGRQDCLPGELEEKVRTILRQMIKGNGPDGWNRLGATSSCTGQITVVAMKPEEIING